MKKSEKHFLDGLPNYRNRKYKYGDYEDFPYATELLKERTKTAFMSTRTREEQLKAKDMRLYNKTHSEFEEDYYPGPGYYYGKPTMTSKKISATEPETAIDLKSQESSLSLAAILAQAIKEEKAKFLLSPYKPKKSTGKNKSGLTWGRREDPPPKDTPGPMDYDIQKEKTVQPSKVPFNSTSARLPSATTLVPLGHIHLSPLKKPVYLRNYAFNKKPELKVPLIICVGREKDRCSCCHRQIWSKYFYYKDGTFYCLKCARRILSGKRWSEKIKFLEYTYGRYCWRYHSHGYRVCKTLIDKEDLDYIIRNENLLRKRSVGVLLREKEPAKKRWEAGREGGDIYHELKIGKAWMYKTKDVLCDTQGKEWCFHGMPGDVAPGRPRLIETNKGDTLPVSPTTDPFYIAPGILYSQDMVLMPRQDSVSLNTKLKTHNMLDCQ